MGSGSQTGMAYTPPPLNRQTGVKTLSYPKLRLWAVEMLYMVGMIISLISGKEKD